MISSRKQMKCCRRGILLLAAVMLFAISALCQPHADSLRSLINDLQNGPVLYYTPEAQAYFVSTGNNNPQAVSIQQDATLKSIRAALTLADMGTNAGAAVPALVDRFVSLEHVVENKGLKYVKSKGSFEDWEQTYIVSSRSDFISSSYVLAPDLLEKCDKWIEAIPVVNLSHQRLGANGVLLSATVDLSIIVRVDVAAYALNAITNTDAGTTREGWQQWLTANGASYQNALLQLSKPRVFAVGAVYSIHLVTGDTISGTLISHKDSTLELKTASGKPYLFRESLVDTAAMLHAAAPDSVPSVSPVVADTAKSKSRLVQVGYAELLAPMLVGEGVQLNLQNGSIIKGELVSADKDAIKVTVEKSEMTIQHSAILRIFLVQQ